MKEDTQMKIKMIERQQFNISEANFRANMRFALRKAGLDIWADMIDDELLAGENEKATYLKTELTNEMPATQINARS